MQKFALSLPGYENIANTPMDTGKFTDPVTETPTLGIAINRFGEVALYVAAALMFFWAIWGVFDYIRAEGNKEALAKARKRIQWAIVGFIILILAFFISEFVRSVVAPTVTNRQIKSLTQ